MIKAVIFDFDGVIVESADIKTEAFAEMFSDYPDKVKAIIDYHVLHMGISRYVKFRYIYKYIIKEKLTKKKEVALGEDFSKIVLRKILAAPFVKGAKEFLEANKDIYKFFIASGTPQKELDYILNERGIVRYFKEVCGSPKTKPEIVKGILKKHKLANNQVVYIGDAQSDRLAAEKTGVVFIERKAGLGIKAKNNYRVVKNLTNLDEILIKING